MRKVMIALAVAGIVVSALSLVNGGVVSKIGPVPAAAVGIVGYLLLTVLAWFRRRGWMLLFAWIGLGFSAYLTYVEAFVLRTWSAYCVISQCIIAVIAVLAAIDAGIGIANRIKGATDAVDQVVTGLRYG